MPTDDPASPEPDELQRMLEAGVRPAEAAVRLGLPLADAAERAALRRSSTTPVANLARERNWKPRLLKGLVALLVLAVIAFATVQLARRGDGSPSPASTSLDAGLFLTAEGDGKPVTSVSARDLFAAAVVAPGAALAAPPGPDWSLSGPANGAQASFLGQFAGRALLVTFTAGQTSQLRPTGADGFVVNGQPPVVLVEAQDLASGRHLRVTLSADGEITLGDALPDDLPVDARTGDRLDTAGAHRAGTLVGASVLFTSCPAPPSTGPCVIVWTGQNPLLSPGNGTSCFVAPGIERVDLGATTLLIKDRGDAEPAGACPPGSAQPVHTGDALAGSGSYFIYALSSSNQLQSAAVSRDGTIYVGPLAPASSCPCHPVANPFTAGL